MAKKSHEDMEKFTRQSRDNIAETLPAALSTMAIASSERFLKAEAQIEANTNTLEAMQTRIDALEMKRSQFALWLLVSLTLNRSMM